MTLSTPSRSTSSDAHDIGLVTDERPVRNIGVLVLLTTFGVIGAWSSLAPIDSAAVAPGFVTVKSHRKTVQHLDGGIVKTLLVKEGDVVKAGDALVILDDTESKAQLEIIRGQFIALSSQVARLTAERDQQAAIRFPANLSEYGEAQANAAKQSESQLFTARRNAQHVQTSVLNQRISQLESKIKGLQGQRASKQALLKSYDDESHDLKELLAKGYADKSRLRDIERNHALATGEIAALTSEIASSDMQIGETRLQILQVQKQFQEEVATKLTETQTQLYDISQRLIATRDKLNRTTVTSPADGRVLGLSVFNAGGVITPGKPILDVVPEHEELIIDAQVSPMDIDRVSTGLQAEVRFSAFKQALTPKVYGKVIHLSADRITDERNGNAYYQAQIELTPDSVDKMSQLKLLPGMPAEVLINTGERTAVEYLLQPLTNAFARAFRED